MARGMSKDGKEYQIGSAKGNDFVNNAKAGSTMVGGDGSTWTKNSDGSTTISKNGTTYTVGGTSGSSGGGSSGGSSYGGSSGSSSGNSSSGGSSGNNRTMPDGFQGSATGVNVWDTDQSAIRDEMNRNSQLWHTADDAERERLHARNLALAKLLNENGGDISFDDASGTWGGSAGRKQQQSPVQGGGFSNPSAPKYDNRYDEKLNEIVDEILQRDPFSYSAADDPLYKYYQGQYERNGDKAMRDTLGQVAARTGGLGSSYAGSAAQQQYNDYMQGLNDIVPELYKLAYSMYQDEADTQRANVEMLQALEAGDYAKFQDLLAQYNTDRSFNYGVFKDQRDFNYQQQRDSISDARYDSEWEYKKNADADDLLLEYAKLAKSGSSGGNSQSSMKLSTAKDMAEQGIFSDEVLQAFYDNGYTDEYLTATYGYEPDKANGGALDGYNPAYFRAAMNNLSALLAQGKMDNAVSGIDSFWNKLSEEQREQVQELLSRYGLAYQ